MPTRPVLVPNARSVKIPALLAVGASHQRYRVEISTKFEFHPVGVEKPWEGAALDAASSIRSGPGRSLQEVFHILFPSSSKNPEPGSESVSESATRQDLSDFALPYGVHRGSPRRDSSTAILRGHSALLRAGRYTAK